MARKRPAAPVTGPSKRLRNGECFKWRLGECKLKRCRFAHAWAACGATDHHAEICKEASADHRKNAETKWRGGIFELLFVPPVESSAQDAPVQMVQVPSGSLHGLHASRLLRLKDGGGIHSTADC